MTLLASPAIRGCRIESGMTAFYATVGANVEKINKTKLHRRLMRLRVMPELKSAAGNPDHSNPPLKQRP